MAGWSAALARRQYHRSPQRHPQRLERDAPSRQSLRAPAYEVSCNIEIYDNDFQFIRDNPVEPEDQAVNWWIYHNRIYNGHGWISLDGVGGGPMYIYGNVGWFDDKPSRSCVQSDWAADHTLHGAGVLRADLGERMQQETDRKGLQARAGKRTSSRNRSMLSTTACYIRAPIIAGGRSKFRAWNNATLFCEPDDASAGNVHRGLADRRALRVSTAPAPKIRLPIDYAGFGSRAVSRLFRAEPGDEASHSISSHPEFPVKLDGGGLPVCTVGTATPASSTRLPEISGCDRTASRGERAAS